ncbi:KpsF/GutQ family sugar-phosphate isomerase [Mucilaginibacter rubeus]|uniref:KpsF/GutQ family sugar-phosphate isomerase n=1 Tax=Mucilaginibacter rubeus TaxID=2027860 RepID=A0AAE6MHD1_9SPHI|nr:MULTISPECIES: KpsF/GutQ family sugar-phosphate isomerase [Mucilaginibacter]QEM03426.1 KpsF/GutQ family sugar-phosphate isomerase [Mucilaginibacter rubeus]QEM16041.1 KpsF/GutQ family sugar-phosphate isomerase [Mucilaginibacter gossypii]QTE41209.1 KpsF/GutQ family sugar-phosphate isomerase [Mucilaginibacter rubeus]QTE47813.1 KpsF/GutQ family sugar-phosphate isomerase [Mucilaginibacter rubeus]QTE59204.1 KpsF/GutQ family sugar-phosphate isomerase [Mucilaginibacter rubeus]
MKDIAKRVFDIEIESLQQVAGSIDDEFARVVDAILKSTGKLVVIGIGKSGLIGKKIAATLASTGTPSFFLHPGEAFHGDLGMVGPNDIVLLISYSGETDEVLKLIPYLKWNKNVMIGITGNPISTVAKNCSYHLNIKVEREACPLELAPTSSTTAALVMGDALAIALMESRNFQQHDFARFHPGGSLGRKLLVKVKDLMRTDKLPFINEEASFMDLLLRMSEGRLGMVIVGDASRIKGVVTDGDLRRALLKHPDTSTLTIAEIMTVNPVIIDEHEFVGYAEQLMLEKKITTLLVGSAQNRSITGVYQIYTA